MLGNMRKRNAFTTLLLDIWHLLVGGSRLCPQDRLALQIASRYGLTKEYKEARKHNLRPLEALEDWDMVVSDEERELFYD